MPNGLLGTRGSIPGKILLGWIYGIDDYIRAIGSPALYYRFEEYVSSTVAADYTGARPGNYNGSVTLGEPGPSYGAALFANGASLNTTTSPLNIATGSISFWCKFTSLPTQTQLLLGFIDSANTLDKTFAIDSTGNLTVTLVDSAPKTLVTNTFTATKWNNFTLTFDGTNAKLYVNGVFAVTVAVTNTLSNYTTNNNLYIANGSTSPAFATFPGVTNVFFDELVVWNNVILTDYQALGLYNVGLSYLTQAQAYITQQALETAVTKNPIAFITHEGLEVARTNKPNAQVTSLVLEVVRQTTSSDTSATVTQLSLTSTGSVTQTFSSRVQRTVVLNWGSTGSATQNLQITSPIQISWSSTASVTQNYTQNKIITVSMTSNVSATQTTTTGSQQVGLSLTNNASATQKFNIERTFTWSSHVSATQIFVSSKNINRTFKDQLTVSELYTKGKSAIHTLSDQLSVVQNFSTAGSVHNTVLYDFQVITNSVPGTGYFGQTGGFAAVLIVRDLLTHQAVTGIEVINGLYTTILGQDGLITLPAAEFGDSFGPKIKTNVLRSMTGKTYTYVQTNPNDKFSLSFVLGLLKAYELKLFCIANWNNNLYMQLWDGRQYIARVISENIPLTFEGRWQGPEREKVTVTLEFEGQRTL